MQAENFFRSEHAVQEHECNGGVHTAGHEQEHLAVLDLVLDALRNERQIALHVPSLLGTRKVDEVFEQLHAELAVRDFWMELDAENLAFRLVAIECNGCDFAVLGAGHNLVAFRKLRDLVTVAHPHRGSLRESLQKRALFIADDKVCNAVFLHLARFHVTAQLLGDELVTVADAELRHREVQYFRIVFRSVRSVNARRTATVNDTLHAFEFRNRGGRGVNFGKHAETAYTVGNQVSVLPTKVQNGNSINVFHTTQN